MKADNICCCYISKCMTRDIAACIYNQGQANCMQGGCILRSIRTLKNMPTPLLCKLIIVHGVFLGDYCRSISGFILLKGYKD